MRGLIFLQARAQDTDLVRPAIAEAIRRRSLTFAELARRSTVGEDRIKGFLSGKSDITTATLSRLMRVLSLELR